MEAINIDAITDLVPLGGNFHWFQERLANIQEKHMVTAIDGSNYLIQRLEVGIFNDFLNLRVLNLTKNALIELQNGIFDCLVNLERIDLSFNLLNDIQDSIFINNSKLVAINLANNMLSNINSKAFSILNYLSCLDLSHNQIKNLYLFCLACIKLQKLDLSFNYIQHIDHGAFFKLTELVDLRLNNNKITMLRVEVFCLTTKIEYLNLGSNFIQSINSIIFFKLKHLKTLNLSYNLLNDVSFLRSIKIDSLTDLDITNRIQRIENHLFHNFKNLAKLKIMICCPYNSTAFSNLCSLMDLDFFSTFNEILSSKFFKYFNYITMVKLKIVFQKAQLRLPTLINTFINLEFLHIEFLEPQDKNHTVDFLFGIGRMTKLQYLILKNLNQLTLAPLSPSLDFWATNIICLDLTRLQNLYIDDILRRLPLLEYLNLSYSKIEFIQTETMYNLVNLKSLIMKNSGIIELSTNFFANNRNLEVLDFENCPITIINDYVFMNLVNLQSLNLKGIYLHSITTNMLYGIPATTNVYLN